jgi:hypothetical protein
MSLYMESATFDSKLNLTIAAPDVGETIRNMNLVVNGEPHTAIASTTLFLRNTQSGVQTSIPLIITAPGVMSGGLPFNSNMNLSLMRDPTAMIPMYIMGPGNPSSGTATMYVTGAYTTVSGISLVVPATHAAILDGTSLYSHGF